MHTTLFHFYLALLHSFKFKVVIMTLIALKKGLFKIPKSYLGWLGSLMNKVIQVMNKLTETCPRIRTLSYDNLYPIKDLD